MKKFTILGFFLLAFAGSAHAQGPQCRTSPAGTSTPSCASEAFVTNSVAANSVSGIDAQTGAFTTGGGVQSAGKVIALNPSYFQNYRAGLALSNDGGTPNSVLDIAAGIATDTTNAAIIKIGAFTKSTAGAWAAGSGSNGMGNGLTIANSTWYHVCLANNSGTADIWFDTAAACTNRPSGISDTKFRRIGSFKTDGSAHILAFTQADSIFVMGVPTQEINATNPGTSAVTRTLSGVPTGVVVEAILSGDDADLSTNHFQLFSPLAIADTTPSASAFTWNVALTSTGYHAGGEFRVLTNTSAQIRQRQSASGASDTLTVVSKGWRDFLQ